MRIDDNATKRISKPHFKSEVAFRAQGTVLRGATSETLRRFNLDATRHRLRNFSNDFSKQKEVVAAHRDGRCGRMGIRRWTGGEIE